MSLRFVVTGLPNRLTRAVTTETQILGTDVRRHVFARGRIRLARAETERLNERKWVREKTATIQIVLTGTDARLLVFLKGLRFSILCQRFVEMEYKVSLSIRVVSLGLRVTDARTRYSLLESRKGLLLV